MKSQSEVQIGDLKIREISYGGFAMVSLMDADDGDVIILDEDKIVTLHQFLGLVREEHKP